MYLRLVLFLAVFLLVLSSNSLGNTGISYENSNVQADGLVQVIKDWTCKNGNKAEYNIQKFDSLMNLPEIQPSLTGTQGLQDRLQYDLKIGNYLKLEDGSSSFPPLRTGKEVALYNRIKESIATASSDGTRLSQGDILKMGLDACKDPSTGISNLQITFLTIHNVMRVLARSKQWSCDFPVNRNVIDQVGHTNSDPMYPVFMDLLGYGTSGGNSLPDILGWKRYPYKVNNQDYSFTSDASIISLFNPRDGGVFTVQDGSSRTNEQDSEWNGGCFYYFWIGVVGQTCIGAVGTIAGYIGEKLAKSGENKEQGDVELSHFEAGSIFAKKVGENEKSLSCHCNEIIENGNAEDANMWLRYGNCLESKGHLWEATVAYWRAIEIDPDNDDVVIPAWKALDALAYLMEQQGD